MSSNPFRRVAFLALLVVLTSGFGFGNAQGEAAYVAPAPPPPNPMNVAADALILRPVGLILLPVAGLVYCIGYPFARSAGNEREVYQSLLGDTIDTVFHRPLGRGEPFE